MFIFKGGGAARWQSRCSGCTRSGFKPQCVHLKKKKDSYVSVLLRCGQQGGEIPAGVIGHQQKQRGEDEKGVHGFILARPTLLVLRRLQASTHSPPLETYLSPASENTQITHRNERITYFLLDGAAEQKSGSQHGKK